MQKVELRTGIWYSDRLIALSFPDSWDVVTHWPDSLTPLTHQDILRIINSPVGQPPLHEAAKNKKRPVIIVDDLSRPTPVFKIMPFILEELNAAGIPSRDIRILVATGTHGIQDNTALVNKIGQESLRSCELIIHNDRRDTKFIGKTSFRTPVYVNKEVIWK